MEKTAVEMKKNTLKKEKDQTAEKKKKFKMPHLLWIMFGIILLSCLATYLIPAGQFATNEAGAITDADGCHSLLRLFHKTPDHEFLYRCCHCDDAALCQKDQKRS
ncbi:MAG: hypothetical protein ACOYB8_02585 [Eubacteriaceae bacterium]|jgi:hypothetical protein